VMDQDEGYLRIGELSRRSGSSVELLRAWERRYGLLSPSRSAGGYRLYSDRDAERVKRMRAHLDAGLSAAQAARVTLAEFAATSSAHPHAGASPEALRDSLRDALDRFDEVGAHAALDRLLASYSLEMVMRDALLPYLRELGERYEHGEAIIGQEHFGSALLRGRLLALARGWGAGVGPMALLACVPANQHDLALIMFGLALRAHGWRIAFLGPDTPLATILDTARSIEPAVTVLSAALPEQVLGLARGLSELAGLAPLALAGGGVDEAVAARLGAHYLGGDPLSAAVDVANGSLAGAGRASASRRSTRRADTRAPGGR